MIKRLPAAVLNLCNKMKKELHKPIIRKLKKTKSVFSTFNKGDLSKFNEGFRFLLCVIDIFGKYAWVVHLKYKKGVIIVNPLQSILKKCNRKLNKIWVDKGCEFCNTHFKK